jgi:hypothetical protein
MNTDQDHLGSSGGTAESLSSKVDPHEYVCGIVRDGKKLDLRVDQLTLEEVQQVLCQTFDMVDALEADLWASRRRIKDWRYSNKAAPAKATA